MVKFTFCSLWYLTERKAPTNIGTIAIINKLAYATAIPSGVAGIFAVVFAAVSFPVMFTTGTSFTLSAIFNKL